MSDANLCSSCGAPLSARNEPCSRCLLAKGLDAEKEEKLGPGFLDDVPMPPEALVIADRYRVIETIGRGGMGVVYKAWQENLNRVVAVKMLNSGSFAGPEEKQRFIQEAKAVAQLNHPNIVTVFDWGEDGGMPYFSMEYVAGQSLAEAIRHQPLEPRAAAEVVRSIAVAIHYAHQQGILHRDLKPANILLGREQRPKVTDFGIAKLRAADQTLTASGQVLGSPGYLPPEQISPDQGAVGATCDVYSLGAVLYCSLTGKAPFGAGSMAATLRQILESEPVPLRRLDPTIPRDLETICLKCLEKSPSRRYQSALDLAQELGRCLAGEPIQAKPVNPVARLGKWAKRRPVEAALTTLAAMLLVAGLLGIDLKRREAVFERQRAEGMARAEARERGRADDALSSMQMRTAEDLFEQDQAGPAVALLASVVRRQPTNRIASERLVSALAYRLFFRPHLPGMNHPSHVFFGSFSLDGQRVVTVSSDKAARVWDWRTGQGIARPLQHDGDILSAAFSPDGKQIVTASEDKTVRVWDAQTGRALVEPLRHDE